MSGLNRGDTQLSPCPGCGCCATIFKRDRVLVCCWCNRWFRSTEFAETPFGIVVLGTTEKLKIDKTGHPREAKLRREDGSIPGKKGPVRVRTLVSVALLPADDLPIETSSSVHDAEEAA